MTDQLTLDLPPEDPVVVMARMIVAGRRDADVLAVSDDHEAWMAACLVAAGTWDVAAAKALAPRLVARLRAPCRCGGRSGRPCRLRHGDKRHGTRNGYQNQGCACEDCTWANTRYIARRRVA